MESLTTPPAVLKPLPSFKELEKELESFSKPRDHSEITPRQKLCSYMALSAQIKRPLQSAMILLVGVSGAGKSSTINHLLDTGEGDPVANASDTESQTKETSEYVITVDEPDYEVSGLTMSIIDTPGLNDTDGDNQDACNFLSIQTFFRTHPNLRDKQIYPNLVFLVVKATDVRIKGPGSSLTKNLRGIKLLDAIDQNHPNLVVVVTWCCSVAPKKWKETMQKKKDDISTIVFQVLGVHAPVVLLENDYDNYDLPRDGDFTLLPNNEKQPKNLYEACLSLLERNKDYFGLIILNSAFQRAKKDRPKTGYKVKARDLNVEKMSEKEEQFSSAFHKAAKGDPLAMCAMEYIEENKLDESQKEEIMKLVESMSSFGLSDEAKLKSVTIGEINYIHRGEISEHGIAMLEQKFGIRSEIASLNSAQLFGQGYDIITDTSVAAEIMKFDTVNEEKFGFKIPGCAQISKVNQTQECQMKFKSHESYIQSRLTNLGLSFYLASTLAKIMEPKIEVGIRSKNDSSVTSTKTTETSLIEYRMAKISIGSFQCDGIKFTDDFSSAVEKLPNRYINDDDPQNSNKAKFGHFFKHFGQHVVTSAFVGGSVEVTFRSGSSETSEENEKSRGASAGINIPVVGGFEAGGKSQTSSNSAKNATTHIVKTVWHGGRSDLHSKSTLMSEEKLQMWKASLAKDPILLTTEMRLMPISKVVAIIDEEKGDACYEALCDLFGIKDSGDVFDREQERASQAENEKDEESRRDSNTRAGSVKAPDLSFFLPDSLFIVLVTKAVLKLLRFRD